MLAWPVVIAVLCLCPALALQAWQKRPAVQPRFEDAWDADTFRLGEGAEDEVPYATRELWKNQSAAALRHAYDSYVAFAAPADDIRPRSCAPHNSQGGIGLTLLDSLDALLVLNDTAAFRDAVRCVEQSVSFDKPARVHVFETTIRALGGLLAAHAAAAARPGLVPRYAGSLLEKARDLGARLLPAFDTPTGLPASHVHLQRGVDPADDAHTCTACATTLSLEFAALSEATGDPRYAAAARRAVRAVYRRRSGLTGLVGNTLHTATGAWERPDAGVGAGADSYWEYLLKMYLFSGASEDLAMFVDQYAAVQRELRLESADGAGAVPWLVTAHMHTSEVIRSAWLSSLAAFWPGMQALVGQVGHAERLQAGFVGAFQRLGWLPERFPAAMDQAHHSENGYPLRPEVIESAYYLHSATRRPWHVRAGGGVLRTLLQRNRCECGFCAAANVTSGELSDTMESFFISETAKYLYLLFHGSSALIDFFVLSTEGHPLPPIYAPCGGGDCVPEAEAQAEAEARRDAAPHALTVCRSICEGRLTGDALASKVAAARAAFPLLTFDAQAALALRARRCAACLALQARLDATPPQSRCAQAQRLGAATQDACSDAAVWVAASELPTQLAPAAPPRPDDAPAAAFDAVAAFAFARQEAGGSGAEWPEVAEPPSPLWRQVRQHAADGVERVLLCLLDSGEQGDVRCERLAFLDAAALLPGHVAQLPGNVVAVGLKTTASRAAAAAGAQVVVRVRRSVAGFVVTAAAAAAGGGEDSHPAVASAGADDAVVSAVLEAEPAAFGADIVHDAPEQSTAGAAVLTEDAFVHVVHVTDALQRAAAAAAAERVRSNPTQSAAPLWPPVDTCPAADTQARVHLDDTPLELEFAHAGEHSVPELFKMSAAAEAPVERDCGGDPGLRVVAAVPFDACAPLQPPPQGGTYAGAAVLAQRGGCTFAAKATHAAAARAAALLVANRCGDGCDERLAPRGDGCEECDGLDVMTDDPEAPAPERLEFPGLMVRRDAGLALAALARRGGRCGARVRFAPAAGGGEGGDGGAQQSGEHVTHVDVRLPDMATWTAALRGLVASGALSSWSGSVNGLTKRVLKQLKPAFSRLHALQGGAAQRDEPDIAAAAVCGVAAAAADDV